MSDSIGIEINGKYYKSIRSCCRELNLSYDNIYNFKNVNNLDSMKDAVIEYLSRQSNKCFKYDGIIYSTKKECCEALGLCDKRVYNIASYFDISFKCALDKIIKEGYKSVPKLKASSYTKREKFEYNGVVYDSKTDCCKNFGLEYSTVSKLAKRHCWDFSFTLDRYISGNIGRLRKLKKDSCVKVAEVEYLSQRDCCEKLQINDLAVHRLMKKDGLNFSDAAYIVKYGRIYRGIHYHYKRDLCTKLGLHEDYVYSFARRNGIDFFDALDYMVLRDRFNMISFNDFMNTDLFNCGCKSCSKEFLFTRDLAFKHMEECIGVDLNVI